MKEAVLVFGRKARVIERRYSFKKLLYFEVFLVAEFDRGHIAALRRIINWMHVGAPNGATLGHSIIFGSPPCDFPQDWAARRYPRLGQGRRLEDRPFD